MAVPKEGSAKAKELAKSNESLTQRRQTSASTTASENARFASEQDKYDAQFNTQANIAKQTGSGRFAQGGKISQLTPIADPNISKSRNIQGGYDYTVKLADTAYFSDSVQTGKTERQVYQTSNDYNQGNQTARAQNISSDYNRQREFLQRGSPEAQAFLEYLNQRKTVERPTRSTLEGYLADRNIEKTNEGNEFIEFITANEGTSFDRGAYSNLGSTYFDPKTKTRFSAASGEGDLKLAERLGFRVSPQPPSIPAGNNAPVQPPQKPQDVQAVEKFLSGYKSTTPPPRSTIEGYLSDRNIPLTQTGRDFIERGTYEGMAGTKSFGGVENIGTSFDRGTYSNLGSTYRDPRTGKSYDSLTRRGDQQLAYDIGKRDQPPAPDPLGVTSGLQKGLNYLQDKAVETRNIAASNADSRTKAKANIENFQSEFGAAVLNIPASALNIGGYLASLQKGKPASEQLQLQTESTEDIFIQKSFAEKDIPTGIGNIPSNVALSVRQSIGQKGVVGTAGSLAFTVANLTPVALAAKPLIPLKIATLPVKSDTQGTTKQATVLVATLGEKTQPLVSRVTEKTAPLYTAQGTIAQPAQKVGSTIGKGFDITQVNLKKIGSSYNVKEKGGAELAGLGRTEEKMLSSEKNLGKLVASGDISQSQADRVISTKAIIKETARVPDKPFRSDFGDQPFSQIAKGKETDVVKGFFKEKNITVEGSAIDIITFRQKYASQAGDFDVKVANYAKAQEYAKDLTSRLNIAATGGRYFERTGGKITAYEGGTTDTSRPIFTGLQKGEYLHGSSESNIDNIINYGIDTTKSKRGKGFFITGRTKLAGHFAKRASNANQDRTAYAKIMLKEKDVLDFASLSPKQQGQIRSDSWLQFQKNMIQAGEKGGYKAVRKPYYSSDPSSVRTETIVLDSSVVKSVTPIKPIGYKVTGGKKLEKAGEFLSHDDPTSSGQISKTGKVFGVGTSQKTYKTEGIKRKGLQYQLGRRGASITSIQAKGNFAPPINPQGTGTTRAKDLPRFYAGAKSAAQVFRQEGQTNKALKIEKHAENIKRSSPEINFDDFFASRKPITAQYAQAEKQSFDIASNIGKAGKQSSPFVFGGSSFSKGASGYAPKSNNNYSPANNISKSNLSGFLSKSKSSISKSASPYGKSSTSSVLSASKSSSSKSSTSKFGSSISKLSGKSAYGPPSRYSSKSYYGKSGSSTKSPSSKSILSLYPSGQSGSSYSGGSKSPSTKAINLVPTNKPILAILKGNLPNKRNYPRKEKATQTLRHAVKNPFSKAFSIYEGRKGKRIERF